MPERKKISPGRAAVIEWRKFRKENEPKMRELLFRAYLRGVITGQANPKTRKVERL